MISALLPSYCIARICWSDHSSCLLPEAELWKPRIYCTEVVKNYTDFPFGGSGQSWAPSFRGPCGSLCNRHSPLFTNWCLPCGPGAAAQEDLLCCFPGPEFLLTSLHLSPVICSPRSSFHTVLSRSFPNIQLAFSQPILHSLSFSTLFFILHKHFSFLDLPG
jgi:hypothetical protein